MTLYSPFNPVCLFQQTDTLGIFPFEDLIPRPGWICLSANPPPHAVTRYLHDAAGTHRVDLLELGFRALAPARGPKFHRPGVSILEPVIDPSLGFDLLRLTCPDVGIGIPMPPLTNLPDNPPHRSGTRPTR
jgi:hypothetical protein